MSYRYIGEEELDNVREVIDSQSLFRGDNEDSFAARLEDEFGNWLGRNYIHAVSSGTCANETAIAGLGLEPGDEVICPALAPIFVSFPVVAVGCVPVFADVDPRTYIISPAAIKDRLTERTRAIVVVHLFGQPAPMDEIMEIAKKHNLKVVEDCAQAFDAYYHGKKVGTIGDVACFSFQQSKHITSGEGGIIATGDPEIYKRAVLYANCGMPWYRYDLKRPAPQHYEQIPTRGHFAMGHNYRMSELQAAVCVAQLPKLPEFNERRDELVSIVRDELKGVPRIDLAQDVPDTKPNYWAYPVRLPETFGNFGEVNYLEFEFQKMHRERRTSVGQPLPSYVKYEAGLCPEAETASKRLRIILVHHRIEPGQVREAANAIRKLVDVSR